ncbi:MAG: hypothetical protein FVQ83_02110 [Chloroflexi bacterium]|nr:hypothetical protein [Chloroflexota bacterium]
MRRKHRPGRSPGRRPPMRGMRRRGHRGIFKPRIQKELRRANHLNETGDHANAAVIFERLAIDAHDKNILRHAPMLYLQAAHAFILSSQVAEGVERARTGLEILAETGRWHALQNAGQRTANLLSELGFTDQAQEIDQWLEQNLAEHARINLSEGKQDFSHGKLPPKCPYCGATVRPDETNWINSTSAECVYCGSTIQTK